MYTKLSKLDRKVISVGFSLTIRGIFIIIMILCHENQKVTQQYVDEIGNESKDFVELIKGWKDLRG